VRSSLRDRGGVFISYRREETAGQAGRLYKRLSDRFGEDRVFRDIDSIASGVDFTNRIIEDLSVCNVLLALVGRHWSVITDSKGTRRLDNPGDYVRVEIEIALQRDIPVIPVLVDGAALPQADDLPPSLRPLTRRQARKLSHTSFQSDVTRLISDVDKVMERRKPSRLTVTSIRAPAADVPALAEALRLWYENQGLEAIMVAIPTGVMVQCRTRQTSKRTSGMSALLTVILRSEGEDLLVDIGSAEWLGKANAAKATAAGGGLAAASLLILPIAPVAAGAAAVGIGARRWRQHRLSNQTISFLRETAPTHVRGA
jgi:hypothetical protein